MWTLQTKKNIENNIALDKLIHWKIRLGFLRTVNSGALMFTGNQPTKDTWLLQSSSIFKVRKLTKNSTRIWDFLAKIPRAKKHIVKKTHRASRFFVLYAKQKISLTWSYVKIYDFLIICFFYYLLWKFWRLLACTYFWSEGILINFRCINFCQICQILEKKQGRQVFLIFQSKYMPYLCLNLNASQPKMLSFKKKSILVFITHSYHFSS